MDGLAQAVVGCGVTEAGSVLAQSWAIVTVVSAPGVPLEGDESRQVREAADRESW